MSYLAIIGFAFLLMLIGFAVGATLFYRIGKAVGVEEESEKWKDESEYRKKTGVKIT